MQVNTTEVMTVVWSPPRFHASQGLGRRFLTKIRLFPPDALRELVQPTLACHPRHPLAGPVWLVVEAVKHSYPILEYIADSCPMSGCGTIRLFACRLYQGEAHCGQVARMKRFVYGLPVPLLISMCPHLG